MQTEMRTSMQREAVAHLTAMDITMKCHSQFHKELAIMFDDPFERAEDEQHPQCCYGNRCKRFDLLFGGRL